MTDESVPRIVQEARAADSSQIIQIAGNYYSGDIARTTAMRTLPRDMAAFTGREAELTQLIKAPGQAQVVTIHTVDGMPGVGKTALVTHAAHLLAEQFPDGQLFVPLHAHTPGRRPADPSAVLATLLASTGLGPGEFPAGLDARAQRWRDRLAGKKVLLVFDDVADHTQIEPLLPGTVGCLVLVTSRRRLIAFDGAQPLSLDTLSPDQAVQLFTRLIRRDVAGFEANAVTQLVGLCGRLPLAIALLAGRLAHHPAWSIPQFAADFAAAQDRLAELTADDRAVAAAFELSYQELPADRKRLFRRLGLYPGADIDAYGAAALDGIPVPAARRHLEALYTGHLIDEPVAGRYRMHDLIGVYARTLAARDDPASDREQAIIRLLNYYQHTAETADRHLSRHTRPSSLAPIVLPVTAPILVARANALAWIRAERANLLACIEYAARHSQDSYAIRLTAAMAAFLFQEGPWQLAATLHEAAAVIAHHSGDPLAEANSLHDLGGLRARTGDYPAAAKLLERALSLYRDLGDRLGEANALDDLCGVRYPIGDYPAAVGVLEQALSLYRDLGDRLGEANALDDLGRVHYMTGNYPTVTALQEQALGLYRELGSRPGEANCLWGLGRVRARMGDYLAAIDLFQQALALHRGLGSRHGEAYSLTDLGGVRARTGQHSAAADLLGQAVHLYRDLGDRHGEAVGLMELGGVRARTGDYAAAIEFMERATHLYHDLGDPFGEAGALTELGGVHSITGDYPAAIEFLEQAQATFCQLGSQYGKARSFHYLGRVRALTGDYPAASVLLGQALAICHEIGDRHAEAEVLSSTGELLAESAGPEETLVLHQKSLQLARQMPSPLDEARALEGMARSEVRMGMQRSAIADLRQATAIYQRIGAPEARSAAALLAALESGNPRS